VLFRHYDRNEGTSASRARELRRLQVGNYCLELELNLDVADPIPHTDLLLECLRIPPGARVLDLCCGTGVIGIGAAIIEESATVVCSDVDYSAVQLASANIRRNSVQERMQCVNCHLLAAFASGAFDLVVSNPPQAPDPAWSSQCIEIRQNSHYLGNYSGSDGLAHISCIIRRSAEVLRPNGQLMLVVHDFLGLNTIESMLSRFGFETFQVGKATAPTSPTIEPIVPYIESALSYKFRRDMEGKAIASMTVITGRLKPV